MLWRGDPLLPRVLHRIERLVSDRGDDFFITKTGRRIEKPMSDRDYDLFFTDTGQLVKSHGLTACVPPCAIHAPTEHHMRTWPLHWRGDRGIMERICSHGIGHPDPDDIKIRAGLDCGTHGCDGCCRGPAPVEEANDEATTDHHGENDATK